MIDTEDLLADTKINRDKVEMLKRRAYYLKDQLDSDPNGKSKHFAKHECQSLFWAINFINQVWLELSKERVIPDAKNTNSL